MTAAVGRNKAFSATGKARQRPQRHWYRITIGRVLLLLICATLFVEALLGYRMWVQLSGMQLTTPALRDLYSLSGFLTSPFHGLDEVRQQHTDVLQISTVVAANGYLMLAAAVFGVALFMRMLGRTFTLELHRDGVTASRRASARQTA